MPIFRIADGAPVPSNQRPLRITVSKLMGCSCLWVLRGPRWLPGCGRDTVEVLTFADDYLTFVDMSVVRGTSLSGYPRLVAELGGDPPRCCAPPAFGPKMSASTTSFCPTAA